MQLLTTKGHRNNVRTVVLSGIIISQFAGILAPNAGTQITVTSPVPKRKVGGVGFRPAKLCKRVIRNRGIQKLALSQAEMYPRTIGERKLTARKRTVGGFVPR